MAIGVRPHLTVPVDDGASEPGRLFETYSDRILMYCLQVLRNRVRAEDAVRTTFLYAERAVQRGVVPLSEYAWLHSVAKNVCRSQQQAAARRRRRMREIAPAKYTLSRAHAGHSLLSHDP